MPKFRAIAADAGLIAIASPLYAQPVQSTPIHGNTPGHVCRAESTARFVGKTGTRMMGAAIKDLTHAAVLRWAPPGTMLTMDYRADRVTIYLDANRKITKVTCG